MLWVLLALGLPPKYAKYEQASFSWDVTGHSGMYPIASVLGRPRLSERYTDRRTASFRGLGKTSFSSVNMEADPEDVFLALCDSVRQQY